MSDKIVVSSVIVGVILGVAFSAQPATIDFEGPARGSFHDNFVVDGLRFSPWCPVAIEHNRWGRPGQYLSADRDNNCNQPNTDYRGTDWADVWIDADGARFTLFGVESVAPVYNWMEWEVLSSKGGQFRTTDVGSFTFSGPEWAGVEWIALRDMGTRDMFHYHHGWDNIRICDGLVYLCDDGERKVPEPATWALFVLAIVALILQRRGHG